MEIGKGKTEPQKVKDMLEALDRTASGPTAPACGLTLMSYEYVDGVY